VSSETLLAALNGREPGRLDEDPVAQLARAETGVAIGWLDREAFLAFAGADRGAFLHRLLTADLALLDANRGRRSLLLDTKGKIVADLDIWGGEPTWMGVIDRDLQTLVVEQLRRYVLRADVTIEAGEQTALALVGPGSDALLQAVGAASPEGPYLSVESTIAGVRVRVLRSDRVPWGCVLVAEEGVAAVIAALYMAAPGLGTLGPTAQETLRVRAGVPRVGHELTGAEFPQEAGLDGAVSFEKGCYLGQETVARIHYRGHVNRQLCRLRLSGAVQVPAALEVDGREVGQLTSVVADGDDAKGLGYVRREQAIPEQSLRVAGHDEILAGVESLARG